ncbi:MAG TPA: glycosyltransferase [Isosphaeraceae bacterium]|jgi:hypothetical protein|nr:glycosyltransferase [Isosphaeraceae bacterium]
MMRRALDRVAVIVAAIDARKTIAASLAGFLSEVGELGEVVLVDASRDGTASRAETLFPGLTVLRRPAGMLAPELWRDGLRATDAPLVVFSTAAMMPRPGWLDALVSTLRSRNAAAVGGRIVPSDGLNWCDQAIYLNRYLNYWKLTSDASLTEPAGDNAIYRRESLAGLESLIDHGFWEVAVHRHMRARGESLALCADSVVEFLGGTRMSRVLPQRFAHARHYAGDRAGSWSITHRILRFAAAPLIPPVLLARTIRGLSRQGEHPANWVPAFLGLLPILGAWTIGEAIGTIAGPRDRREPRLRPLGHTHAPSAPSNASSRPDRVEARP